MDIPASLEDGTGFFMQPKTDSESCGGTVEIFRGIIIGAPISLALWGLIFWLPFHWHG